MLRSAFVHRNPFTRITFKILPMTILLYSKEDLYMATLEFRFRKVGWNLYKAADVQRLQHLIETSFPDALVIDFQAGSDEGMSVLKMVKERFGARLPVLVGAEWDDLDLMDQALQQGAVDFIPKPWRPEEVILRIKKATRRMASA